MLLALTLFAAQIVPDQARTWAIERGFEKIFEQSVSNAKNAADDFVASIKRRPTLTSTWPSVGNGDLSYEVCEEAYRDELKVDPRTFLGQVARRLKMSAQDDAALAEDCAIYYEGMRAGEKSAR